MRRAIFFLFSFFVIIAGLVYFYPKLHFHYGSEQTLLHDKPVACQICGAMMWDGAQAHACIEGLSDTQ